jgi:hypothetical protein
MLDPCHIVRKKAAIHTIPLITSLMGLQAQKGLAREAKTPSPKALLNNSSYPSHCRSNCVVLDLFPPDTNLNVSYAILLVLTMTFFAIRIVLNENSAWKARTIRTIIFLFINFTLLAFALLTIISSSLFVLIVLMTLTKLNLLRFLQSIAICSKGYWFDGSKIVKGSERNIIP